jgi:L,D-transpeptidase ErfK/SrfK
MTRWFALLPALWLGPAQAASYPLPPAGEAMVGQIGYDATAEEDTLVDVARRFRLGYEELVLANPSVDRWLPGEGQVVLLPTRYILPDAPREGIVVNLAEFRLYYYPRSGKARAGVVETFAISAGRDDWRTPQARLTRVAQRLENPAWYPPKSIRDEHKADGDDLPAVVPPGPDNPLGPLALKLAIPGGYFIHGTSKPFGIGMKVTHGCLRLYPEDIERLFRIVPEGTPVRVLSQPFKTAWKDGVLWVEAHPESERPGPADFEQLRGQLQRVLKERPDYPVDWGLLESLVLQPRGVPVPVPRRQSQRG